MNSIDKPAPHAAEEPPEYDPCQLIAKADTFAHATEDRFDEPHPTEDRAVPAVASVSRISSEPLPRW